eukprot:14638885-Heterocapsa_arctica.AAC.1
MKRPSEYGLIMPTTSGGTFASRVEREMIGRSDEPPREEPGGCAHARASSQRPAPSVPAGSCAGVEENDGNWQLCLGCPQ